MQLELPPCDKEVYENGSVVMITHSISAIDMDLWVQKVQKRSNQKVDWHYMNSRIVIRALGNIDAVYASIDELLHEHDSLFQEAIGYWCDPPRHFPYKNNISMLCA